MIELTHGIAARFFAARSFAPCEALEPFLCAHAFRRAEDLVRLHEEPRYVGSPDVRDDREQ